MAALLDRLRAAVSAFKNYDTIEPAIEQQGRYALLWAFWEGSWRRDPALWNARASNPNLYNDTRELWRHADAVVSLYQQFVYPGDLSTDGQPLPDGTKGAIPIAPQVGGAGDDQLLRAYAEWWNLTRYKQRKSLRPKMAAILGDCLTELVDDVERGMVLPNLVWPGWVVDLQLDMVGNVSAYTLEYDVQIAESKRYGQNVAAESYRWRKEVNKSGFWYYKNDRLDHFTENIYEFCPAIWDRHESVWGARGVGAFEKTMQQALEINSVLSHAVDYQARAFASPIGVIGSSLSSSRDASIQMPRPRRRTDAEILQDADERLAEFMNLLPLSDNGKFVNVPIDIGKTMDLLEFVEDSVASENPEAKFWQQLAEMTQLTAPGVERAASQVIGKVKAARDEHDPRTIAEGQMAIAMMGQRLKDGDYAPEIVSARSARYDAFRPFDLGSYGRGEMDCSLPDRPVLSPTEEEKLNNLILIESLTTDWARERAGMSPEDIAALNADAKKKQDALDATMAGFRAAGPSQSATGATGVTGAAQPADVAQTAS